MPGINANVSDEYINVNVDVNDLVSVSVSNGIGPQGAAGASGVVNVSAPITNAGTSSAAVIGLSAGSGLAVSSGSLVVSYGNQAGTACQGNDGRLSDSREWSAATVSQAEAEAGSSTSRLAFTPLRVFQAVAAWWAGSSAKTKLDGIASGATANQTDAYLLSRANHTGTQLASTISDFTTAVVAAAPPTTNASLLTSGTLPDARLSANVARTSDVSSAVAALVNSAPATLDTLSELAAALGSDANFSTTVTNALAAKAPIASPTFTGTVSGVTKSMVGLSNVDNTSDANKPVSTATQTALDAKASVSHAHAATDITDFSSAVAAASPEEVVEYTTTALFPASGNSTLLYIATDASRAYRWTGAAYVEVGPLASYVTPVSASSVSGLAASATTDTTNASNLSSGTLSASRLPTSGVTAGTYTSVSVDATGRVTAGSSPSSGVKLALILALQ